MPYRFIAIEGNIGAGKTSLAARLAAEYNARLILEEFEDNPFLPKFYQDPSKYAFPLELTFLAARYQQLTDKLSREDLFSSFTISDYFIHKSLIFARNTLETDEYQLYSRLFSIMMSSLPRPDLLVYLYAGVSRLQQNIRQRGRSYEQSISDGYLEKIQSGYLEHLRKLQDMRILIIDVNNIDFVDNPDQYTALKNLIFSDYPEGMHYLDI